ncbi:MAG: cysteine hydrolase [Alphaproteobacteria bacterium]|nr:cysteine hydrolase [Alphaproteobacteria bacterium]
MSRDLLQFGPLTARSVHLCIDMQMLFAPGAVWAAPWMERVLPRVATIAQRFPERTVFTRFVPPLRGADMPGTWRRFYDRWPCVTGERLDPMYLELLPGLRELVPPAEVVDRATYSAFGGGRLRACLAGRGADALVVTGAETDICVLATVLGAVDRGHRVILVTDALCSSSDTGHDAILAMYRRRFGQQIETVDCETILSAWNR